jgi:peptidyl-prolyl cis-trans isomerase C
MLTILFALSAALVHPVSRPLPASSMSARTLEPTMIFDQLFGGGKAKASHILLNDGGRANFIKGQIEKGEITFAAAAKEFSTCPSSAKGGDLGLFGPGQMVPQFDAYCFDPNTELNEMGIVRTQFGTHIVKLTKKP